MSNREQEHVRQVHYKETYLKTYQEKYKELQPEKYKDTMEKVTQRGSTPAGIHTFICVNEIPEFLQIQPGQKGLDATLGYEEHTQVMLECLKPKGHLLALDVDPVKSEKTRERLAKLGYGSEILTIQQMNFADIDKLVAETGPFDSMTTDLGMSSMRIDNPDRGFSYKAEGPLDLRLNPVKGETMAERLKAIALEESRGILLENTDEPYTEEIVKEVITTIERGGRIDTIMDLRQATEKVLFFLSSGSTETKEVVERSCQRTLQAFRIDVDSKFEILYNFLEEPPNALAPDDRVAILAFHSGGDYLAKKSFKQSRNTGIYSSISTDVIRPFAEECNRNPRVRSTEMRWVVRA